MIQLVLVYLRGDNAPGVEDAGIGLDAEDGWLDHAPRVLSDLVVEVLVLGAGSSRDERLDVLLLSDVVTKLVSVIRVALDGN